MDPVKAINDDRYFLGRRLQLAFVIDDMDAALELWTKKFKAGPFVLFEQSLGDRQFFYRGQRSPVDMAVALSYIGDTQIELIHQRNDAPSIFTGELRRSGGQAHHIAFWPENLKAAIRELTSQGFEEVATIQSASGEVDVHYFNSPASLGLMLELVPETSARRVYFSKIKALCDQSTEPRVLRFRDRPEFLRSIE